MSVRVFQKGLTEPQTSPCLKHCKCKHSLFTIHISVFSRAQDNHVFLLRNQTSSDLFLAISTFHSHSHTLPSKFFQLWPRNIYCLSNSQKHSKFSSINGNHVFKWMTLCNSDRGQRLNLDSLESPAPTLLLNQFHCPLTDSALSLLSLTHEISYTHDVRPNLA